MQIIPFTAEHGKFIATRRLNNDLLKVKPEYTDMLDQLEKPGMSWTGLIDDKIIAAGGMVNMWGNVYEGWVMATIDIHDYPIQTARIIKKIFDRVMVDNKVERLQTTVRSDFEIGHKFAQWLGLKSEGIMKHYMDKEDYNLYARVF
tara:strand:- start:203 stop:640 length:438 start_codon:yes stop_codon:yes gene_type:complete